MLATIVLLVAKALGYELPLSEGELLVLLGAVLAVFQSLMGWFQRRATERVEAKVNGTDEGSSP